MNCVTEAQVLDALQEVIDPEIDCNIVDLGLIYSVEISGARVVVTMTLTTQGCPMHDSIAFGVRAALLAMDGVEDAEARVVWDPPWSADMMTEEGRARVGLS